MAYNEITFPWHDNPTVYVKILLPTKESAYVSVQTKGHVHNEELIH